MEFSGCLDKDKKIFYHTQGTKILLSSKKENTDEAFKDLQEARGELETIAKELLKRND